MLVLNSTKHQPEFDFAAAQRVYAGDEIRRAGLITSPRDLYAVETLRDRFNHRLGPAVPTDVFVFGKGQPPRPDCTQFGGMPFWPSGRRWPIDDKGDAYRFFGQINFADSKDLVGKLPGDLLLLFIGEDQDEWYWEPMAVQFEWAELGSRIVSDLDPELITTMGGPFFGAIFRSADYPEARQLVDENEFDPPLGVLEGTKIGGVPHFPEATGQFLCQIGSIQAAPDVPYPWVNRLEPLGLGLDRLDDGSICGENNQMLFGDMKRIHIYHDGNGRVCCRFDIS